MRQWMVNPRHMCRQHLLGEHVEHHMFLGVIKLGKSMQGYFDNNLLEPDMLATRHGELVVEMQRRGMNHKSPLDLYIGEPYLSTLPRHTIDRQAAAEDLFGRCETCRALRDADHPAA